MFYIVGALLIALLAMGGLVSCEHKRANVAEEGRAKIQGQYDAYRLSQEDLAKEEKAKNDLKEKTWNESNSSNNGTIADLRAKLAERMRAPARALVRPDGSAIRKTACPGPVPDGKPGQPVPAGPVESVPKADYVALENRATNDVLRLTGLQKYVREVCLVD